MTERPFSITTQIATPHPTAFQSSPPVNDAPPVIESADEEPYTIKCICDFSDDDGNTIYCEKCDTWQHIECFYPGRVDDASRDDFDHSCADCKPRPLDRRNATERQHIQRQNKSAIDSDKKTKRPPSKSHKKRSKPSDVLTNGSHDHDGHKNGSPQEHHPHTKKPKGHRSSQSIHAQNKKSPPFISRPHNNAHPPSPAHTPPDVPNKFQLHSYSESFLTLYDQGPFQHTSTNSFASLSVSNSMTDWLRDESRLFEDAGVRDKEDVFANLTVSVDTLKWPELRLETKDHLHQDMMVRWRYLTTPSHLPDGRIVELNGLVGFQKDYCNDVENRWTDSAHPRPFVFFHPRLPLCIDTRQEGSIGRYVRRSCRPNTDLGTFIAGGAEYHFWLTTERPLAANEQITIPWDFRFPQQYRSRFLHLLNLDEEGGAPFDVPDITDEEFEQLTQTIQLVLSDHGGCACDLNDQCAFARFHRNYNGRTHILINEVKSKKARKPKQTHASPTSTGHFTTSCAPNEVQQEANDEDDNRSVSGSIRSKPQSRDLTPAHGSVEVNGILTEPSDREKRKLAMLEDTFRKMEQGQPPRKKKRVSDGSTVSLPLHQPAPQTSTKPRQKSVAPRPIASQTPVSNVNGSKMRYVDVGTSRRPSRSPSNAISPILTLPPESNPTSQHSSSTYRSRQASLIPKSTYADASTQTDEVAGEWWSESRPRKTRSIVPLAKRLLRNRYKKGIQEKLPGGPSSPMLAENPVLSATDTVHVEPEVSDDKVACVSPIDLRKASISTSNSAADISPGFDLNMTDAPVIAISNPIKPPPPPWPGQSNPPSSVAESIGRPEKPSDLCLQLPPTPQLPNTGSTGPPSGSVTPSSVAGSTVSPFGTGNNLTTFPPPTNGIVQQPSPVKTTKKLSLSDYKARMKKNDSAAATNKSTTDRSPTTPYASLKPNLSAADELKMQRNLDRAVEADVASEKLGMDSEPGQTPD